MIESSKFTKEQDLIISKAIATHGIEKQLDMVTEEAGEILTAINKLKRSTPKGVALFSPPSDKTSVKYSLAYYGLCSELADNKIMFRQLEMMLDPEAVQISIDRKLERLNNRLNKKEY